MLYKKMHAPNPGQSEQQATDELSGGHWWSKATHWLGHHWKEIGTGIAGAALVAGQFIPGVDVVIGSLAPAGASDSFLRYSHPREGW